MSRIELVKALFQQALELPADIDKTAWIRGQTNGDAGLFEEVQSLVEAHVAMQTAAPAAPPPAAAIPAGLFGPYRAVELLGRGGTSAVYRAERADGQFQQTVALKVLAGYLSGPDFLRRFETERQLLASLSHPRITHLLDGGISSTGDPYLVMEYVEGERLDWYCDEHKLSLERRLRLFLQICDAVDYAHRNLIVHRDLKPNNILVTAEGEAKLLDFGTAALLAAGYDITLTRTRMMTPRYASPERLRGERATPTNDVFSLGVLLYELLTGAWPFGNPDSMLRELQRAMGDAAPISLSLAATAEAAASRMLTLDRLRRALKGDLAAIAMKALEHDEGRRYASVRELAADVERYLDGRPVNARAQTSSYRVRKFLRRRWLPVTVALVFVLGISGAAILTAVQAKAARVEAAKAEKVAGFLKDMLSSAAGRNGVTVLQMLEEAEPRIAQDWKDDPLTEAGLRLNLGASYVTLGKADRANFELGRALDLYQAHGDYRGAAITRYIMGQEAEMEGHLRNTAALYRQGLDSLQHLGKAAPVLWDFRLKHLLGVSLEALSSRRWPEAEALMRSALAEGRAEPAISKFDMASTEAGLAGVLAEEGRAEDAERMLQRAAALSADPSTQTVLLTVRMEMAGRQEDFASARDFARQRFDLVAGMGSVWRAEAECEWARFRAETGETAEAERQIHEALPMLRRHWGDGSDSFWHAVRAAAQVAIRAGHFEEAERYARESIQIVDMAQRDAVDTWRAESLELLGEALLGEKKYVEAMRLLQRAQSMYGQLGPAWTKSAARVESRIRTAPKS